MYSKLAFVLAISFSIIGCRAIEDVVGARVVTHGSENIEEYLDRDLPKVIDKKVDETVDSHPKIQEILDKAKEFPLVQEQVEELAKKLDDQAAKQENKRLQDYVGVLDAQLAQYDKKAMDFDENHDGTLDLSEQSQIALFLKEKGWSWKEISGLLFGTTGLFYMLWRYLRLLLLAPTLKKFLEMWRKPKEEPKPQS